MLDRPSGNSTSLEEARVNPVTRSRRISDRTRLTVFGFLQDDPERLAILSVPPLSAPPSKIAKAINATDPIEPLPGPRRVGMPRDIPPAELNYRLATISSRK
jgi:hypothetical protein